MSPSKKLVFIVNPISGTKGKISLEQLIPEVLDEREWGWQVLYTQKRGDATSLALEYSGKADCIVAVGGDGTINEVAQGLLGSSTPMAIIPRGSGNGFANYFKLPHDPKKALKRIKTAKPLTIDTGLFNGQLFLCVAGIGFDAHIAHAFDHASTRGFWTYTWLTLKTFMSYRASSYQIEADGQVLNEKAFLITIANATQFGNNAFIAPQALVNDGWLDLVILKPFSVWHAFGLGIRLFTKSVGKSSLYKTIKVKQACIKCDVNDAAQIDGEPAAIQEENKIVLSEQSLIMMV